MNQLIIAILANLCIMTGQYTENIHISQVPSQSREALFSFGILADVQYADADPAGTRFYRSSLVKLNEALESFKADSVDFVITLGDLIDRDYESYKPAMKIINNSGLKFYHVTGNHDYNSGNKSSGRMPSAYKQGKGYYSFTHKKFRFVFLNGNEISTYASSKKSVRKQAENILDSLRSRDSQNAMEWNGAIGNKQLLWFESQLKDAVLKNEQVFIFCHFPVFPENVHNLLNNNEILELLKKHDNIIAWMNGHNHAGNYGNTNATHFITLKGMVETSETNSFARIDVYRNKIWIVGRGREKNQILAY